MINFENIEKEMRLHRMKLPPERIRIQVANAATILKNGLNYFLSKSGIEGIWLPEYEQVAQWLEDNKGKGLFLYGNCGRGKTLLCTHVIPAILLYYCRKVVKVYDVQEMNKKLDEVLSKGIIAIDDVGTEEMIVNYGERRLAFAEIMDAAEKDGKLVIVSTNLSADDLKNRYGDRVLDRIKATTVRVLFKGESLRG